MKGTLTELKEKGKAEGKTMKCSKSFPFCFSFFFEFEASTSSACSSQYAGQVVPSGPCLYQSSVASGSLSILFSWISAPFLSLEVYLKYYLWILFHSASTRDIAMAFVNTYHGKVC